MLVRPAVEAGERLGFLPGDLTQKVDPYLRPMYDALYEMMGFDRVARFIERNVIEVAPLAFMRGRSLNDSFIILDEAQNTTPEQMKMFLTRIGFGSRAVVTGDVTQTDLPAGKQSGLRHVINILRGVEGVAFTFFDAQDVVRHPLVQRIVQSLRSAERQRNERRARRACAKRVRTLVARCAERRASLTWATRGRSAAARATAKSACAWSAAPRAASSTRTIAARTTPTNVLSFPASPLPAPVPRVRTRSRSAISSSARRSCAREAREQRKSLRAHWAHLVVHGALHLIGYDHERDADARRMERREIAVLRRLGFTNPYRSV